jgi:hypothetical protein
MAMRSIVVQHFAERHPQRQGTIKKKATLRDISKPEPGLVLKIFVC